MKKIILTLSGVLFVIVTGCSLLICMMNGIPNLDQPAAAFYLAKAILLSFSLPLVTLGLFVHCLQLRRKLDKDVYKRQVYSPSVTRIWYSSAFWSAYQVRTFLSSSSNATCCLLYTSRCV